MKREAEAPWATERVENALLRERINDIATEVARLTMVLEGPDSPIETILNSGRPAAASGNGPSPSAPSRGGEATATLADRIRTLQARVARGSPPLQQGAKRGSATRGARADK